MSKSTNAESRAEARRRSRIAAKERAERGDEAPEEVTAPVAQAATGQSAQSGLGFRAAFRGSFGVAPIRDDLRQLPRLLRTRAFFVPLAATILTTIVATQQGVLSTSVAQLAVQSILLPPAFVVAFLAGMLTRRASWLLGGLFGLISYGGALVVGSVGDLSVLDATNPVRAFLEQNVAHAKDAGVLAGDLYGVAVSGIFAGAFAGWYGRFLRSMSPARPSSRDLRRRDAAQRKGGDRR
jgi:hypothetical protein